MRGWRKEGKVGDAEVTEKLSTRARLNLMEGRGRKGCGSEESETQSHGGEGKKWGVKRERWKGKSKGCGSEESKTQSHGGEGKK